MERQVHRVQQVYKDLKVHKVQREEMEWKDREE
jgi:hypothetical protein